MASFASVDPAPRPGRRPLVPCIPTSRRVILSVPLVFLVGFILTTWFDVLDPIPGLEAAPARIPALQTNPAAVVEVPPAVTKGVDAAAETEAAAAASSAAAVPSTATAPVPAPVSVGLGGFGLFTANGSDEADHDSPFSFDLASILTGANASLYSDWMAGAPDDWSLARLAIPGTHDTLTHRINLVGFRCQNAGLDEQLAAGVRYLDVRARVQIQPETNGDGDDGHGAVEEDSKRTNPLGIYHATAYTGYEFADVAETVFAFLEAHPTEVVIMRLKEEALPINGSVSDPPGPAPWWVADKGFEGKSAVYSAPTPPFLQSWNHYRLDNPRTAAGLAKYLYRFNTTADPLFQSPPPAAIPTVGQLRGKILMLQEFPYFPESQSYLVADPDATPWYGIPWQLSSSLLQIEDYWQTPDLKHLDNKWDAVRDNLQAAARNATAAENGSDSGSGSGSDGNYVSSSSPLFLSHLSASVGITPIDAAAGPANRSVKGINDRTGRWLERGDDLADLAERAERAEDGVSISKHGHYTPVGVVMADFPGRRLIDAILRRNGFFEFDE
ncbi:hypothetical protein SCUCBS95973_009438 [Sporothrix curviconia]|uniref:Phosphatidylinositol-specific phospholipase C X domain-containing protein n=1 Tax=Sporothrix curviconia TaxID=1260050 RepID=A0ABP0CUZ5_9PEZI